MQLHSSNRRLRSPRRALAVLASTAGFALASASADAYVQTLRWQHADATQIAGFRVYARSSTGSYGAPTFDGLPTPDSSGVYHFDLTMADGSSVLVAVTAYDAQGLESPLSNERQYVAPAPPPASPPPGGGGGTTPLPTTYRLNAGGAAYTDASGNVWQADSGFASGGTTHYNPKLAPLSTQDKFLFQSSRYDNDPATNIRYELPVPDGHYRVSIHAMESWDEFVPGQRVFDVRLEGQLALDDFDMLAANPQWATPHTRSFDVDVTDGAVSVELTEEVWYPTLSALEVVQISSTPIGTGGSSGGTTSGGGSTGSTGGSSGGTGSTGGTGDPGGTTTPPPAMGAPGQPQIAAP